LSDALPPALRAERLVAPPLLWPETRAALHQLVWRGELAAGLGVSAAERLDRLGIESRSPRRLGSEAWRIAEEFGWAKTYDAEYVALAHLLRCRMATLDAALARATARLGIVFVPPAR